MNETEHMNSYLDRFETFVQLCAARQPSDTVPRHEIAILWHGYITGGEAPINVPW